MDNSANSASLFRRFLTYQKERFPFLAHGVLIAAFTFSAVSYSRICRGAEGFVGWTDYAVGVFLTVTLFFLVRVFDEFKDKEEDSKYRTYLPVPRGLISLKELAWIGFAVFMLQVAVLAILQPEMLFLYGVVMAYLLLMRVEFFIPEWLKAHQIAYIASHMVIIPLIDIYASGLDWFLADEDPHYGLLFFFGVSYFNGIVLEFGRKIKTPEDEEEGVLSYTKLYGTRKGTIYWLLVLTVTYAIACSASYYAGYGGTGFAVLSGCWILCAIPGIRFLQKYTTKRAKMIEHVSAVWTILMYLSLGGVPMLESLL